MDWSEVDLKTGYITVQAAKAKTKVRRLVPIADNLKAWLMPLAQTNGKIIQVHNLSKPIYRLSRKSKIRWHRNALRNSFVSYRVALTNDVARVAFESGNSARMIATNYLRLVSPEAGKAFFSIYPTTPANVVPMARVDKVAVS
jgi:integrase